MGADDYIQPRLQEVVVQEAGVDGALQAAVLCPVVVAPSSHGTEPAGEGTGLADVTGDNLALKDRFQHMIKEASILYRSFA